MQPDAGSMAALEELDRALVLFGVFPRGERPQVSPSAGARIELSGIQSELTGLQFANHDASLSTPLF
jgi:hypothetical protein